MKFISVLLVSITATVSIGLLTRNIKAQRKPILVSPLVSGANTSASQQESHLENNPSVYDWQVFTNNYYGYKIKYPPDVYVKNLTNGDVVFQKPKTIDIQITQEVLPQNASINTVIEREIDKKINELGNKCSLKKSISPIALSSVTAQSYTTMENGEEVTYYYLPQDDRRYLLITNRSPNSGSVDFLISEDIIYSLELIPQSTPIGLQ